MELFAVAYTYSGFYLFCLLGDQILNLFANFSEMFATDGGRVSHEPWSLHQHAFNSKLRW